MVTKREKFLLWKLMNFDIHRYLMSNSCQRLDGAEKADRHIKISKLLVEYITIDEHKVDDLWKPVHDYLADILTDRMDEIIGFPIDKPLYGDDYDLLAEKFFSVIIKHMTEIEQVVNCALANGGQYETVA